MKNLKKLPTKQLEKFSNIFTQLGLVLVLFIIYVTLEYETPQKQLALRNFDTPNRVIVDPDQDITFVKEPKNEPKTELAKAQVLIPDEVVKGENDIIEHDFLDEPKEDIVQVNPDDIIEVDIPVDIIENVPYAFIQEAPVFKGCEGLSKEENKKCFDKKMERFVQRNFDLDLASEIGLASGKYKIQTQFIIDNKGNVIDIKIRAPHLKLKKEAKKMIEKLPKFKPGRQNNRFVKVRYNLPITFKVD